METNSLIHQKIFLTIPNCWNWDNPLTLTVLDITEKARCSCMVIFTTGIVLHTLTVKQENFTTRKFPEFAASGGAWQENFNHMSNQDNSRKFHARENFLFYNIHFYVIFAIASLTFSLQEVSTSPFICTGFYPMQHFQCAGSAYLFEQERDLCYTGCVPAVYFRDWKWLFLTIFEPFWVLIKGIPPTYWSTFSPDLYWSQGGHKSVKNRRISAYRLKKYTLPTVFRSPATTCSCNRSWLTINIHSSRLVRCPPVLFDHCW